MEFLKTLLSFDVFNLRIVLNCLSSDSIISFKIKAVLGLFASINIVWIFNNCFQIRIILFIVIRMSLHYMLDSFFCNNYFISRDVIRYAFIYFSIYPSDYMHICSFFLIFFGHYSKTKCFFNMFLHIFFIFAPGISGAFLLADYCRLHHSCRARTIADGLLITPSTCVPSLRCIARMVCGPMYPSAVTPDHFWMALIRADPPDR